MLDLRDLERQVVGAPMAGGPSTPALAAEISAAGGLGFLAGGYRTADQVATEVEAARTATSAPIGLKPDANCVEDHATTLKQLYRRLGDLPCGLVTSFPQSSYGSRP